MTYRLTPFQIFIRRLDLLHSLVKTLPFKKSSYILLLKAKLFNTLGPYNIYRTDSEIIHLKIILLFQYFAWVIKGKFYYGHRDGFEPFLWYVKYMRKIYTER